MAREVSATLPSASRRVSLAKLVIGRERLAEECGVSVKTLYKYLNTLGSYVSLAPAEVIEAFLLMKCRGIHFYTFPPGDTPWLWLLVNVFTVDLLADLLELYRSLGIKTYAISVIVDSGVDRYWRKPCSAIHADYTEDYWNTFWSAVDKVKILRKEFGFFYEVVVPDYVDDYSSAWGKKHCLWIDNYTNIDRTLENVFYMIEQDKNIKWLTPAQGYEDVPESILKSIGVYVNHGLHKKYRIGLANLCTSKKTSVILETVRLAREVCKECRYHIFGPSLTAVKKSIALGYLQPGDSWDSTAWTFPRGNGWSCKSSRERVQYFLFYLRHVVEGLRGGGGAQRKAHE